MKIIFFLPAGVIEWPVPDSLKEQFSFPATVAATRLNGCFQGDNLYLRHDAIVGMSFAPDDAAPVAAMRRDLN